MMMLKALAIAATTAIIMRVYVVAHAMFIIFCLFHIQLVLSAKVQSI